MSDNLKFWIMMLVLTMASGCCGPATRINWENYHRMYDDCMEKARKFPDQDYVSADSHCSAEARWRSEEEVAAK